MSCLHPSAVNTAVADKLKMARVSRPSRYCLETDSGALHYACFTCISPCRRMCSVVSHDGQWIPG